jgi:hypothetical protein
MEGEKHMKSIEQTAYEIIVDGNNTFEDAERDIEKLIENTRIKFLAKLHSVNKKHNYNIFIENECVFSDECHINKKVLFETYKDWCQANNFKIYHIDNILIPLYTEHGVILKKSELIGVGFKNG